MATPIPNDEEEKLIMFQCKICNTIITDSSRSDGANINLSLIVLKELPATLCESTILEDGQGVEEGCVYFTLHCSSCDAVIGKFYKTVPKNLLQLKGCPTLELAKLKFYTVQLDSSLQSSFREMKEPEKKVLPREEKKSVGPKMSHDIQKMQYVICHLDERIRRIENLLHLPNIEDVSQVVDDTMVTSIGETSQDELSSIATDAFTTSGAVKYKGGYSSPNRTGDLSQRLSLAETNFEESGGNNTSSGSTAEHGGFSNQRETKKMLQKRLKRKRSRSPKREKQRKRSTDGE